MTLGSDPIAIAVLGLPSPLIAACGVPSGALLTIFFCVVGAAGLFTWLGVFTLVKGWKTRSDVEGKALFITGAVICSLTGWFWLMLSLSLAPR